jgi:DtxR family Mn-dependent transcriptional regulator
LTDNSFTDKLKRHRQKPHESLTGPTPNKFVSNGACLFRGFYETEQIFERGIMADATELSESLEDYLETILYLEKAQKVARAKDIADRLGLQRGTVTSALKSLADKALINYTPYNFITLTPKGQKIAEEITRRHASIKRFLLEVLQIDPQTAEATACRMEHAIDAKSMARLACLSDFLATCPRAGAAWLQAFSSFCADRTCGQDECRTCIKAIELPPAPGS